MPRRSLLTNTNNAVLFLLLPTCCCSLHRAGALAGEGHHWPPGTPKIAFAERANTPAQTVRNFDGYGVHRD